MLKLRITSWIIYLFLICVIMTSGCAFLKERQPLTEDIFETKVSEPTTTIPQSTFTVIPDHSKKMTITPKSPESNSQTGIIQATATLPSTIDRLPELLLNLSGDPFRECPKDRKGEIRLSYFPFKSYERLELGTGSIDNPSWSPDGSMVAYVNSKPGIINDWDPESSTKGYDQIVVVQSDGTGKKEIGEAVESSQLNFIMGQNIACSLISGVRVAPKWSPNQKYLLFTYFSWNEKEVPPSYTLMLVDLSSNLTKSLITQNESFDSLWMSDSERIVIVPHTAGPIKVIYLTGENIIEEIPLPVEVADESILRFSSILWNNSLVGYFIAKDDETSHQRIHLWQLGIDKKEWNKVNQFDSGSWSSFHVGQQWAVVGGRDILVLQNTTWDVVGRVDIPSELEIWPGLMQVFTAHGIDFLAFYAYDRGNRSYGIWVTSLVSGKMKAELLIQEPIIPALEGHSVQNFLFRSTSR